MTFQFATGPDGLENQDITSSMLIQSFELHFTAISEFKLDLQSGNAQFRSKLVFFFLPSDLEILRMTPKNNREPLLHCFKLCTSFRSQSVNSRFAATCQYKLKIESGNAQIGAQFVLTFVTLLLDLDLLHWHHFCQCL